MTPADPTSAGTSTSSQAELWLVDLEASARAIQAVAERLGSPFAAEPGTARMPAATPILEDKALARLALRQSLARIVGPDRASRPFAVRPGGKPALAASPYPSAPTPAFSLSHAGHAVLIAIAPAEPIGVDLETIRPLRLSDHRRVLLEQAALALVPGSPLPDASADQRFIQAWVRLEAFAKATGEGIGHLLGRIREGAWPPLEPASPDGTRLSVRDLPPVHVGGVLHLAALAGAGPSCDPDIPAPLAQPFPSDPDRLWHWLHVTSSS